MMKKIMLILCLAGMSSSLQAGPIRVLPVIDVDNYNYARWCLNHMVGKDTCPTTMSYHATQATTIIFYVTRYLEGTTSLSDPLRIDCNNVPVILHRGASYSCTLPVGGVVTWKGETDYIQNGIEGGFVRAE